MRSVFFLMTVLFLSSNALIAQNWEKYKAEDLQFIAYFPSEPKRTVEKVNTDLGKLDMHAIMYSSESGDDNAYGVMRMDYPEEQFKDADEVYYATVLDGAVNETVSNLKGILVYNNIVKFNGYPGRSVKISAQGAFLYINIYLVENSIFMTQVFCTEAKDENASIQRFLNSFELIKTK